MCEMRMLRGIIVFAALLAAVLPVAAKASAREVRVSSFGFDPEDSTRFIQSAIDSGADKVVFDKMPTPWYTRPLRGASRQELFFVPGAVLAAKPGEFTDKNDVLLTWAEAEDVSVIGPGATIRMSKADYQKAPYQKSEWRHALSFLSCRRVRVEGLSILDSGGDGIYIGRRKGSPRHLCEDVVIRDVSCEGNHRQGISVISVRNLLVERCRLNGTCGAPPAAGIDLEPNSWKDELAGIVVRDCRICDNAGDGIDLSLHQLRTKSRPVDVLFENCIMSGNYRGFAFSQHVEAGKCVGGLATLRNCVFKDSKHSGIDFQQKLSGSAFVRFEACRADGNCRMSPEVSDVCFSSRRRSDPPPANVDFGVLDIVSPVERPPVDFLYAGWCTQSVENIVGTIIHRTPAGTKKIVIDDAWRYEFAPPRRPGPVHAALECTEGNVVDAEPGVMMQLSELCLRGRIKYVFHAARSGRCRFKGRVLRLRGDKPETVKAEVSPVGGGASMTFSSPADVVVLDVGVQSAGFYEMAISAGRCAFAMTEADVPVGVFLADDNPQNVIFSTGDVFFTAPTKGGFALYASGEAFNERVDAALYDPAGQEVWRRKSLNHPEVCRVDDAKSGLWRVAMRRPEQGTLEDWHVDLTGAQPVLFLNPSRHW